MEETTQQSQENKPTELTVTDLVNIKSLIEVSVKRGTFSASELSSVGTVYDKLNNFLNAINSTPAKQAGE